MQTNQFIMKILLFFHYLLVSSRNDDHLEFDKETGNYVEKAEFDGYDSNLNFKRGIILDEGDVKKSNKNTVIPQYRTWNRKSLNLLNIEPALRRNKRKTHSCFFNQIILRHKISGL